MASAGRSSTACCGAEATITSGRPLSRTIPSAARRDDPAAPVAEAVAIGRDRHRRADGQVIGNDDIGCPGEMHAQHSDQGRRLWKVVDHLVADANLHTKCPVLINCTDLESRTSPQRVAW